MNSRTIARNYLKSNQARFIKSEIFNLLDCYKSEKLKETFLAQLENKSVDDLNHKERMVYENLDIFSAILSEFFEDPKNFMFVSKLFKKTQKIKLDTELSNNICLFSVTFSQWAEEYLSFGKLLEFPTARFQKLFEILGIKNSRVNFLIAKKTNSIVQRVINKVNHPNWKWLICYHGILESIINPETYRICSTLEDDINSMEQRAKQLFPNFEPFGKDHIKKILIGEVAAPQVPFGTLELAEMVHKNDTDKKYSQNLDWIHKASQDLDSDYFFYPPFRCKPNLEDKIDTDEFSAELDQKIKAIRNQLKFQKDKISHFYLQRTKIFQIQEKMLNRISLYLQNPNNLKTMIRILNNTDKTEEIISQIRLEIQKAIDLKPQGSDSSTLSIIDYLIDFLFGWSGYKTRLFKERTKANFLNEFSKQAKENFQKITYIEDIKKSQEL